MAKIAVTKLKYVRLSKGETIEHMTEILEVSRNQYVKWEEGTSTPPKIKKEFLGEYFNINHKKLFTKFWIERELIEELEKKTTNELKNINPSVVTILFAKYERLRRKETQETIARKIGFPKHYVGLFEREGKVPSDRQHSFEKALAEYFDVSVEKLYEPKEVPSNFESRAMSEIQKIIQNMTKNRKASLAANSYPVLQEIDSHALVGQDDFNKKVDEMSGQEVRELVKRTYAQNLRYEEENNKLKATIAEIQNNNSEETNYKQRFEELQESTKGIARVAELTKELFVELSVGSF